MIAIIFIFSDSITSPVSNMILTHSNRCLQKISDVKTYMNESLLLKLNYFSEQTEENNWLNFLFLFLFIYLSILRKRLIKNCTYWYLSGASCTRNFAQELFHCGYKVQDRCPHTSSGLKMLWPRRHFPKKRGAP